MIGNNGVEKIRKEAEYKEEYDDILLQRLRKNLRSEEIEEILLQEESEEKAERFRNIYRNHPNIVHTMYLQTIGLKEVLILYPYEVRLGNLNLVGALDIAPETFERKAHCKISEESFTQLKDIANDMPPVDSAVKDAKYYLRNSF